MCVCVCVLGCPGNAFLDHVQRTTGATVQLRGAGTGQAEEQGAPLHVHVQGTIPKQVEDAKA